MFPESTLWIADETGVNNDVEFALQLIGSDDSTLPSAWWTVVGAAAGAATAVAPTLGVRGVRAVEAADLVDGAAFFGVACASVSMTPPGNRAMDTPHAELCIKLFRCHARSWSSKTSVMFWGFRVRAWVSMHPV